MSRRTAKEVGKTVESIESKKKTQLNSTVWPKPTRMRTTSFTRVTTMQVTGANVECCFVLVRTHQRGTAFQPQAKSYKGELKKLEDEEEDNEGDNEGRRRKEKEDGEKRKRR